MDSGAISLAHVNTDDMVADCLTKAFGKIKMHIAQGQLGLRL